MALRREVPRRPLYDLRLGEAKLRLGLETKIMGILNVTPDSFSDGGMFQDPGTAEAHALRMEREGAHLVDVGGESSRPGSRPIPAKEEIRRIAPVLKRLSKRLQIPYSVDTTKPDVAHAALDLGASLVNDIQGLRQGKRLARLIARYGAGVVVMHMRGSPPTMQRGPSYKDLLRQVVGSLRKSTDTALEAGIGHSRILIDPGFGFGKTPQHNLTILDRLDALLPLGFPVLVGLSRKSFIGHFTGSAVSDRLYGSLAAAAVAIGRGAHILRVHDVSPHRELAVFCDILAARP